MSLAWVALSVKTRDFIKGVQKAVDTFVERYGEYAIAPVIQASIRQMPISAVALSAGYGKPMVSLLGLSSKQAQAIETLKVTFLYQM